MIDNLNEKNFKAEIFEEENFYDFVGFIFSKDLTIFNNNNNNNININIYLIPFVSNENEKRKNFILKIFDYF